MNLICECDKIENNMERFFGMIPSSEVKREETFTVGYIGNKATVQANEHGWSILYSNFSSEFNDNEDTVDNNFNKALEILKLRFCIVTKIDAAKIISIDEE